MANTHEIRYQSPTEYKLAVDMAQGGFNDSRPCYEAETQAEITAYLQSHPEVVRKWDAPEFWDQITIGYCQKCGDGHVLRDGVCWNCRLAQ